MHISTIASAVRCYAIDFVFLKYLRAETAQLIDKTMSKRRFEGEDVPAGWDEDPSSDEDSVWAASDDEMDDATRAAYISAPVHSLPVIPEQIIAALRMPSSKGPYMRSFSSER